MGKHASGPPPDGILGVVLVGSLVVSSYQLTSASPAGMTGGLLSVELVAVTSTSGAIAGEIRCRRRQPFRANAQATYIVVVASLAASLPLLIDFGRSGSSSVNALDSAALLVAFLCGLLALSLRLDDFRSQRSN